MKTYFGFCDPSGGSSDSMTLAIAHRSLLGNAVCDGSWERRAPFSPDDCVREFAEVLKSYRVAKVVGDRYSGEWVRERFREHGITYMLSEKTKSEIYVAFVALLNSGRVKFPGDARLRRQFESLERRSSRSGKDFVDHLPGSHDDVANSVAGALVLAASASRASRELHLHSLNMRSSGGDFGWGPPPDREPGSAVSDSSDRGWTKLC